MRKLRDKDVVADALRNQIKFGNLRIGDIISSEAELAAQYDVSVRAARFGVEQLEAEGLVERRRGIGSRVIGALPFSEGLVAARAKIVPVIFQDRIRDASTAELFDAIQQTLQAWGYSPLLHVTATEGESLAGLKRREIDIVDEIIGNGYLGVLAFTAHDKNSGDHYVRAREAGIHVVLVDHDFDGKVFDCVSIDDRRAAYDATEHLIRSGAKRIVFISQYPDWSSSDRRWQGCVAACSEYRLTAPVLHDASEDSPGGSFLVSSLRQTLQVLLAEDNGRLGIVATNDTMANLALETLAELGARVPEEVGIIGFNDDIDSSVNSPALSSMAIPRSEIGARAALILMQKLHGPSSKPARVQLSATLTIRDSCGCYRFSEAPSGSDFPLQLS